MAVVALAAGIFMASAATVQAGPMTELALAGKGKTRSQVSKPPGAPIQWVVGKCRRSRVIYYLPTLRIDARERGLPAPDKAGWSVTTCERGAERRSFALRGTRVCEKLSRFLSASTFRRMIRRFKANRGRK